MRLFLQTNFFPAAAARIFCRTAHQSRRANPWVLFYHRFISARLVGQRRWSLVGLVSLLASLGAQAQSSTTVCTTNSVDLSSVVPTPAGGTLSFSSQPPAIAIAGGRYHSLALLSNGRTRGWGRNDHGELSIFSADPIIAIAAGDGYSLGVLANGRVVAEGDNTYRQLNVPPSASPAIAVAAKYRHSLALRTDGTVVAWGAGAEVPPASASPATAIAIGNFHNLALRTDGTVVAWGYNANGQANVPASASPAIAIAAGFNHSLSLKANGTIVKWGLSQGPGSVPASASPATAIAAGYDHSLALKADGSVVAWGDNTNGQTNVPPTASPATAIAAGESHSLALKANGSVVGWGDNSSGQANGYDAEPLVSSVVSPTGTQTYYYTARPPGGRPTYGSVTVVVNPTPPARLYVNANATGAGNGQNWTDAFTDLQQALNYVCAQNLTEIWVAQGTYRPTTGTDRNSSFAMKNGVTLYGGFVGTETALNQRNPTSFTTVLSGDLGSSYDVSDNSYHVINNPAGLTNSAVLDGFVITGSNANGNGIFSGLNGGGMLNNGGGAGNVCSPLIRNCIFQDNVANYGGALYNDGSSGGTSSPSLINCLFLSNFSGLGGALYNNGNGGISSPRLTNCSFLNNTALNLGQTMSSHGTQGSSNPVLVNCVVWGNGVSGARTFHNVSGAFITTRYSLLEASATGYSPGTGNLTTSTSPFVSATDARLNNCSGAINMGDNAAYSVANGPATDLAGNARVFPSGGVIDMGAYEFQAATGIIITAPGVSTAMVGVGFSQSFTAGAGTSPYSYSLASGSLPAGLSLASNGALSGIPTQAGSFTLTALATDAASCSGVSAAYVLTVSLAPVEVTPLSLSLTASPMMLLTSGTTTLSATVSGGTGPYSYTFSGPGTITPSGNTASVSGLSAGVQTFMVVIRDATVPSSQTISGTVSVTVTQANTAPVATANTNQTATVGVTFAYTVGAFTDETPASLSYTASISPANGLSFNPATRVITGTPSVSGVSGVTVTATDAGGLSASTNFTITVSPASVTVTAPFAITGVTMVSCTTISAGQRQISFTPRYGGLSGQPISFSVVSEMLPTTAPGPYTLTAYTDNPTLTLKATQSGSAGEASFVYHWLSACGGVTPPTNQAPTTTGIANQSGTVSQGLSVNVGSSFSDPNGDALSFTASGLPAGLSLSGSVISGTPSASGVSSVTVVATDPGSLSVSTSFMLTINPAPAGNTAPTTTGITNQTGTVGVGLNLNVGSSFSDPNGDALSLTASGLPAGLSLSGSTISGTPSASGVSSVTVVASDAGSLSVSTSFTLTVSPAPVVVVPTSPFSITGVTMVSCVTISAGQRQIKFTPRYAGLSGQPISFSVVSELLPTTAPGPYTLNPYTDNPTLTLKATQQGSAGEASFTYNWLAACTGGTPPPPNQAPTVANPIPDQSATAGQAFTYTIPANTFNDPNGDALTLSASGLPGGLSFNASTNTISGTPSMSGVSTVSITATDPGNLSTSDQFTLTVSPSSTTMAQPFAITAVTTVSCQIVDVNRGERRVTFTPQYSGTNGQAITFRVVNELSPTSAPGPYTLRLYTDNPVITLRASQGTSAEVGFVYNWLGACNAGARLSAEPGSALSVVVLGNPVQQGELRVEVRGASGQALELSLLNAQGHPVSQTRVAQAGVVEGATLRVGLTAGVYLLRVSTPTQVSVVKVVRH